MDKNGKSLGGRAPKARAVRLPSTIAQKLGRSILSGDSAPGTLLGGEVEASKQFGVSRTVYREAIRILGAKGLVDAQPRAGTRVSDPSAWELLDTDVLSWIFSDAPDPDLIASIFELRRVIEPAVAGLAAERRSFSQLGIMEAALNEMETFTLSSELGRFADARFHSTLIEASRNPFLVSLSEGICAAVNLATVFRLQHANPTRDPIPDHWRVFEAIVANDADEARKTMLALIDHTFLDTKMVSLLGANRQAASS